MVAEAEKFAEDVSLVSFCPYCVKTFNLTGMINRMNINASASKLLTLCLHLFMASRAS